MIIAILFCVLLTERTSKIVDSRIKRKRIAN